MRTGSPSPPQPEFTAIPAVNTDSTSQARVKFEIDLRNAFPSSASVHSKFGKLNGLAVYHWQSLKA